MTLQELLASLRGDPEAASYLSNPATRPDIAGARPPRSALMPPMPNATLAPNGQRLPLPRIQGTTVMPQAQKPEAYPMVFGPSVGAENMPRERRMLDLPRGAPVMRFRDAATPTGLPMAQAPMQSADAYTSAPQGRFAPPDAPTAAPTPYLSDTDREWIEARNRVAQMMNFQRLNDESRKMVTAPRRYTR